MAYIAIGAPKFYAEALKSAATLRKNHPLLTIVLYTDSPTRTKSRFFESVQIVTNEIGEQVVGNGPWERPAWAKRIAIMRQPPFKKTLFLDTDTEIVGQIEGIFSTLRRFDIAAAHAPYRFHEHASDIPDAFPEFNCGVIAVLRNARTRQLFRLWHELYLNTPEFWHHDQATFRRAIWLSGARIATLPPEFNLRPLRYHAKSTPRILHGFSREMTSTQVERKVRLLTTDHGCKHHRCGWSFAVETLGPLTHPNGVLFDSMVENTYAWHLRRFQSVLPHREPWVGIVHNPPKMPKAYFTHASPQKYSKSEEFQKSLPSCLGLFALSEYQAAWFRRLGVPVEVIYHPVSFDVPQFSWRAYSARKKKNIIHVGWWLRRMESFNELQSLGHRKLLLAIANSNVESQLGMINWRDVNIIPYVTNAKYDALLRHSVVFADLIDASANNVVLDCLARATPLLINRHPAVEEYLGKKYPLFFNNLEHAAKLLAQPDAIAAAHEYLRDYALRQRFTAKAYMESIRQSTIFRRLPTC